MRLCLRRGSCGAVRSVWSSPASLCTAVFPAVSTGNCWDLIGWCRLSCIARMWKVCTQRCLKQIPSLISPPWAPHVPAAAVSARLLSAHPGSSGKHSWVISFSCTEHFAGHVSLPSDSLRFSSSLRFQAAPLQPCVTLPLALMLVLAVLRLLSLTVQCFLVNPH